MQVAISVGAGGRGVLHIDICDTGSSMAARLAAHFSPLLAQPPPQDALPQVLPHAAVLIH